MLALPRRINRSVNVHNSHLPVFCDWIEASVLFDDVELSQSDVLDFLIEQQIYKDDDPDFCMQFVSSAWSELRRRLGWISSGSPLEFQNRRIVRKLDWNNVPAHAFCLILGLAPYYRDWVEEFGSDYNEQGELFEKLVLVSVSHVFAEWTTVRTGWSRDETSRLSEVVETLANAINEDVGNIDKYASEHAHEAGLDLFWHKRFVDGRGGHPVFLGQCASGKDWTEKLHTPEISVWSKIVDWKFPPSRAFAMPFALEDDEFVRRCNQFSGLFLDRYRLLMPSAADDEWIPTDLRAELNAWVEPRIDWVMSLNAN